MPSRHAFVRALALATMAPRLARADALATLHATSAIDDPATPFLYGIESGLFRRYGIDASIERSTSGAAAASAVIGGSFELGKSSVISFLSAHVRGLQLVAVAPAGVYESTNPTAAIVVKPDGPIRTGADLNGKVVAVSALNDLFSLAVRAWVDAHGGDSSTLKLLELPMSATTGAVATGRIDAAVMIQPFLARALETEAVRSLGDPVAAIGSHHTDSVWFTSIDYARKNADTVARFMRAIREASIYVNGHRPETAHLLAEFAKVDPSDVGRLRVLQGTRLAGDDLQPMIDVAARYGVIPQKFDAKDIIYAGALH
jgi:NitT/TauT family transport system substrate-binding protein